jgi:hypothetical protein
MRFILPTSSTRFEGSQCSRSFTFPSLGLGLAFGLLTDCPAHPWEETRTAENVYRSSQLTPPRLAANTLQDCIHRLSFPQGFCRSPNLELAYRHTPAHTPGLTRHEPLQGTC